MPESCQCYRIKKKVKTKKINNSIYDIYKTLNDDITPAKCGFDIVFVQLQYRDESTTFLH